MNKRLLIAFLYRPRHLIQCKSCGHKGNLLSPTFYFSGIQWMPETMKMSQKHIANGSKMVRSRKHKGEIGMRLYTCKKCLSTAVDVIE